MLACRAAAAGTRAASLEYGCLSPAVACWAPLVETQVEPTFEAAGDAPRAWPASMKRMDVVRVLCSWPWLVEPWLPFFVVHRLLRLPGYWGQDRRTCGLPLPDLMPHGLTMSSP